MLDQANFWMIQSQRRMEQEQKYMETLLSTFTENIKDQQSHNFSQDDNVVPKRKLSEERIIVIRKLKPEICEQMFHIEGLSNLILTRIVLLLTFYHFYHKILIE